MSWYYNNKYYIVTYYTNGLLLMDIETIRVYNECKTWPLVLLEVDTSRQVRIVHATSATEGSSYESW
jgi:hypothetical protein